MTTCTSMRENNKKNIYHKCINMLFNFCVRKSMEIYYFSKLKEQPDM